MISALLLLQLLLLSNVTYWVEADYGMDWYHPRVPYGIKGNRKSTASFKRVCYLRMDPGTNFMSQHIDGDLCTHIIYAFCRVDPMGNVVFNADSDEQYIRDTVKIKRKYPHLKLLVSLFDGAEKTFKMVAGNKFLTQRMARSTVNFMNKHSFDGLDLDWEFPSFPKENATERSSFTAMVSELRRVFGRKYLLTVAVPAQERVFKLGFEILKLSELVDWFNLMTYDYHLWTSYTPFTGPNAPLYGLSQLKYIPVANHLSIDWSVKEYIKMGVKRNKIVLGIPTYSRAYKLVFRSGPNPLRPSHGPHFVEQEDYLVFPEVCVLLSLPQTRISFDKIAQVPYLAADNIWVSYEDERSIRAKVKYALSNDLAGYMTWNLNSDNFDRPCLNNQTRNILHKTMLDSVQTYTN